MLVKYSALPPIQDDIEIPIPHYFISENSRVLKERDKMLGTILAKKGPLDAAEVNSNLHIIIQFAILKLQCDIHTCTCTFSLKMRMT